MEDLTALLTKYETRYKRAIKAYENKAFQTAQDNYLKAAEIMYQIAQKSTKELKKVRIEKAKKLIMIAHQIEQGNTQHAKPSDSLQSISNNEESPLKVATIPDVTFDDVVGLDSVKKTIYTQMILPINHPDKYGIYKKRSGGGVLLYGPPGTGKTTIAKAIANEVGAAFYLVKGSDILNKYVGESEKNIAKLFDSAKKEKLAIIFIDDMDSLFMKRGKDIHNDERVNEFLQQIDGFSGQLTNILLLGATNRPWSIDSAVMRPGRFSRHIHIPLPDEKARYHMLKKFTEDIPLANDVDLKQLVEETKYYSGADIFELCEQAKVEPLMKSIQSDSIHKITQHDFLEALETITPSVDAYELKKFNEYSNTKQNKKQKKKQPTNKNETPTTKETNNETKEVQIINHDSVVAITHDEKPVVRFVLSTDLKDITALIDTKHYVCLKEMNHFKTDKLDIEKPGLYTVSIRHKDKEIATFDVTFSKGVIERDMGL